jgi:hypothetical protein
MEPFTFDRIDYENRFKVRFSFCFKVRFSSCVSSACVSSVFLLVHAFYFIIKPRFYEMKMEFPSDSNSGMGFGLTLSETV